MDMLKMDSMTLGYVTAMKGEDPNEKLAYPGSSYEKGYLLGNADHEAGRDLPKYYGFLEKFEIPIKPGMTVTIVKGTRVKTIGKPERLAGRTYKVKVDHILSGSGMYEHRGVITPMRNPMVVWAGPEGYWSEVDVNSIPEAK